jgi:archaellum biogenesis ATPase FlaH/5S rRNA maturation endonuclease (ribonuclease M5)
MRSQWIVVAKSKEISSLFSETGQKQGRMGSFGPCLACGCEKRGSSDTRLACAFSKNKKGWTCYKCNVGGDAVELITWAAVSKTSKDCTSNDWKNVKAWVVEHGIVESSDSTDTPPIKSVSKMTAELSGKSVQVEEKPVYNQPGMKWHDDLAKECAERLWNTEIGSKVLDYLKNERCFSDETIKEFDLGCSIVSGEPWLTIPLKDASERCVNVRFRTIPPAKKTFRVCSGRPLPLFGSDRLGTDHHSPVIVVEGECDVIAFWQYGMTTSVVSGTAGASTWKDEWLDTLEHYDQFIVCYDNDDAGRDGSRRFAEKMGKERCSEAILPRKDAGECLSSGVSAESVNRVIDRAQPMFGPKFKRVDAYESDIERLIQNPQELMGRPTGSDRIDRCLGGLRPGLMVVSGDTGHGKTTFATWLLWMQARQQVPVMITSFEQRPVGTVQKLLRMEIGGDFTEHTPEQRASSLGSLGGLPIHMLDHYGHLSPDDLMQSIKYAHRRLGVEVVLIDHLGFMLDAKSDNKVSQIESIIRNLAVMGYSLGITVILVCHPRGTPPGHVRITVNDLKGSSAIKQDASEVVIVVRDPPTPQSNPPRNWPATWIHFDKVRSEFGVPGSKAQLAFGPTSCIYADSWLDTPEGSRNVFGNL